MSTLQGNAHGLVARPRALRVALIAALLTAGVFALPPSSFGQATVEDVLSPRRSARMQWTTPASDPASSGS